MGAADIVPGVSGGTIAFITGIYERLLNSLQSIVPEFFHLVKSRDFPGFWKQINGAFLLTLFSGILLSVLIFAKLILKEKFNWDDGEVQYREWIINKIDEHNYEGTAGDVVGKAKGFSYGPAFKFEYVLLVPVKGKENIPLWSINFELKPVFSPASKIQHRGFHAGVKAGLLKLPKHDSGAIGKIIFQQIILLRFPVFVGCERRVL